MAIIMVLYFCSMVEVVCQISCIFNERVVAGRSLVRVLMYCLVWIPGRPRCSNTNG